MTKDLSEIYNASKSNFAQGDRWDMHILQLIFWTKKLEEYDEKLNYAYFEKYHGKQFPLDVYFFINNTVCMQLTRATTRNVVHT